MKKIISVSLATLVTAIILVVIGWAVGKTEKLQEAAPAATTAQTKPLQRDAEESEDSADASTSGTSNYDSGTVVEVEPEPPIIEPPIVLTGSDYKVTTAIAELAPMIGQWLLPTEQIRKWVLTIDLIADGKLPKRYRPIDYPLTPFAVIGTGTDLTMDIKNFSRLNTLLDTLTALDHKQLARHYHAWLPIFDKAYAELGKRGSFDARFRQAISHILATDSLANAPALKRPGVLYLYVDEEQENASDVQKMMWRMGPDNREKLQNFVRDLLYYIDLKK